MSPISFPPAALSTFLLALLALFLPHALANSDIITLYTLNGSWITEASATLILPDVPRVATGEAAIWSALKMTGPQGPTNADFLQGVSSNSAKTEQFCDFNPGECSKYCGTGTDHWCNFAYTLTVHPKGALFGKTPTAAPGTRITTRYKHDSATNLWDQTLYVNGKLASTVSGTSSNQHAVIFYLSIECAAGDCAPHPAHTWTDVSLVLNTADPNLKHQGPWEHGATGGEMSTPDGGKTWNFAKLHVPQQKPCVPGRDVPVKEGCPYMRAPKGATILMEGGKAPPGGT